MFKKLFIIILSFFTFGEVIRLDFGGGVALKPIDIAVGLTTIIWLIFRLVRKEKIKQKQIYIPVLFFAGSGAMSLLINYSSLTVGQFFAALMYLVRWIAYAGIFFVVSDFDKDFKKTISKRLIFVGSLIVGLGYLQYFFYNSLRNLFYLGWDEHMYRMFSVFLDPNFAGAFFVLFFLFLINKFLKDRNIPIGILSFLTLGAIFLTFSRSALIMLVVSTILLFALLNKKIWITALVATVFLSIAISSRYFNIENINLFRVISSEARLQTARKAIGIIGDHPVFGVGFNAYRYAKLNGNLGGSNLNTVSHADAGTDNSFLFVIATTGVIGFILYLFLWLNILKAVSPLAIASIIGVFVDSMFINSLFYSFIMLWLWIILALSMKSNN